MSLFVFNNQQKLIKSIPNRDLISVVQDQAINVSDTLFVEMPADIWSNLKEPASYLAVQDPYASFIYHMYKVSKHTTKADTTDVEAIQIGYDELKAYGYIKDRRFNNRPVLEAADAVVSGTDWQIGFVDTDLPNVNTNFYYISRLEALSKLIEATGAEVRFRVEISGNKIIAKRLDLYKNLGIFKGKRFAYGSNLLEIVKEEDTSELYTALVGRGKGEETETGGFGRRITFTDIAWSKASGKPVDKPLGQEFIELPEMTAYYGYPDGEPRTGIVEFGDIEEPEQLLKATYDRLVEISRPQAQFKAKVQTTGDMQLGEEVVIIRSDLGFRYKTRVFRVKRDYLNNMYTEVELGDKLTETLASRIKRIDTTNAQREETIIQYIQTAANGKNKIFRGEIEPTEGMMVNDLWYKPVGEGEMEMYQWDGTMWELILSTLDTTKVQREVEAAIAQAEEAKQEAEDAYNDAVAEAERLVVEQSEAFDDKFETETNTIRNEIETGYTNAITNARNYIDAETTIIDNKILAVEQEVSGVKGKADQTIADINTAVTNAGFTSLDATISHVKTLGEQANSNAQVAVTSAEQSLQIASELAGNAEGMLNDIINTRGLVNGTYVENKVDDATGELSQKITRIETLVGENIRNLVVRKDEIKNQTLSTTGNHISTLGHSISTKLIPVGEGETLSFQNTEGGWRYAWLNQNKAFISMVIEDDNTFTDVAPIHTHFLEVSYTTASSPMITRGSEQKDFVLAPEDNNTDEAFRILQAEYKSDVEGIESTLTEIERSKVSQTDYDLFYQNEFSRTAQEARDSYTLVQSGVEGRLSTAESTITQQAGLIASKVSQTEFDNVNARLTTAETTVSQNKNAIDLRATKTELTTAIDGILVGGRNLLLKSDRLINNTSYNIAIYDLAETIANGETVTVTLKGVLATTKTSFSVFNSGGNTPLATLDSKGNGIYQKTFNWSVGASSNTQLWIYALTSTQTGTSKIQWIKLERGNKATDWTPAPEDVDASIATVQSNLTIESGKISALTSRVSGSETNITSMSQTIGGITTNIATLRTDVDGKATVVQYNTLKSTVDGTVATVGDHSGRITQVETNVNGLQTTVASKADQSQITQLSNAITSTVKNAVDTLEANGRNYFHKRLVLTNVLENTNFVKFGDTTPQGFTVTGARSMQGYIRINNVITGNGLWTVTFDLGTPQYVAVGITVSVCGQGARRFITRDDNKQERVSLTVNVTNHSSVYNFVDFGPMDWAHFTINNIKIEKGGKSTPYVIAIEDTAPSSEITQLANQINLRVKEGEVVSQINVEANRTLISSGKILLDGDTYIMGTTFVNDIKAKSLEAVNADIANLRTKIITTDVISSDHIQGGTAMVGKLFSSIASINELTSKTAFIDSIKAKTLDAITANITSIRSQMLVSDVISSDHIQGGTAMVGKLFSSTASINELTSKTAFINNIKAIDIAADRITTGELNAANVNIINLNVSKIVGLNSTFIQSAWNGINTRINIDATALTASDSAGNQAIINTSGEIRSTAGGTDQTRGVFHKGRLWFHTTSGSAVLNIGAHPVVGEGVHRGSIATARAEKLVIGRYNDYLLVDPNAKVNPYITLEYAGALGDESNAYTKIWHNLSMSGKFINDVQQVSGYELSVRATSGRLMLGVTGHNTLQVGQENTRSYGNIEMQPGYEVTQASDKRWKDIVGKTETNALEEIKKLSVVDYYWKNGDGEKQFGLIAQDSPFLSVINEDGYYGISGNKLAMLNLLSSQELYKRIEALEEEVKLLKST